MHQLRKEEQIHIRHGTNVEEMYQCIERLNGKHAE